MSQQIKSLPSNDNSTSLQRKYIITLYAMQSSKVNCYAYYYSSTVLDENSTETIVLQYLTKNSMETINSISGATAAKSYEGNYSED